MDFSQCCAIVGSASFDAGHFLAERSAGRFSCVVAADGGFASLEAAGVAPNVALGDFDSLGYVPQAPRVERHPVMKDATDLELALEWARNEGHPSVAVYGALGGRLDQTMATLQTMVRFARLGMCVAAVGEGYVIAALSSGRKDGPGREGVPASGAATMGDAVAVEAAERAAAALVDAAFPCSALNLPPGLEGFVSVCAMGGDARVTEQGLLYEVEDVTLPCDSSLGVSNEFTGSPVRIGVFEGDVLVFLPAIPLDAIG